MNDFDSFLADLRSEFRQTLEGRMADVEHAWSGLSGAGGAAARRQLILHAHKLSGLAPTLGFTSLEGLADAVEKQAEAGLHAAALEPAVSALLAEMRRIGDGP